MNMKIFDKMPHIDRLCGKLRRGVAVTLALSMVLPMTTAFGVDLEETCPVRSDKYPDIAIEGNFVRNEFGFLVKDEEGNGVFELGLQVKTPAGESFRALNVSLEYDTGFLAPIDWESDFQEINLDGFDYYKRQLPTQKLDEISTAAAHGGKPASTGGSTGGGSTGDSGIAGGGTATAAEGDGTTGGDATGGATDPALSDAVANGEKALLTFTARSYKPVEFPEDPLQPDKLTTIAVIRFKVDKEQMEHISIKKRADGEYDLLYNVSGEKGKEKKITNVAELQAETATTVGDPTTGIRIMGFATDDDIFVTKENSTVKMALRYQSWTSEYYYVPEYDPADLTTYVTDSGVMIGEKKYQLDKPKTNNDMVLAVDPAAADDGVDSASTPTANSLKYSYITNLIVNKPESTTGAGDGHDYITLPLVSKRSFMDNKDTLGNLTTIVYVDWDNTLLGTQIVPKNTDVRGLVSEYVAENFIYHDDDDTTYGPLDLNNPLALVLPTDTDDSKALDAVKSLARKDNYRGKYPYDGPQPDGTTTNTVTDGDKYALSNKLDYVFLKRPMTYAVPKPDPKDKVDDGTGTMIDKYPGGATDPQYITDLKAWEANDSNKWVQKSETTTTSGGTTGSTSTGTPGVVASYDIENPFAYGWALCTEENFENTWTTLGMGELDSYNGAFQGGYEPLNGAPAEVTVGGEEKYRLVFADLEQGFSKEQDTVFLKAIYEPGEDLLTVASQYRMISEPYYNKLNPADAASGGAYSVDIVYERANSNDGTVRGTARVRMPAVRQETTSDLRWDGNADKMTNATVSEQDRKIKSTYTNVTVDNKDEVNIQLVLSARQNKVDFYLMETYGANFATGTERSKMNKEYTGTAHVIDSYNYKTATSEPSVDGVDAVYYDAPYMDREGSYGFVLLCTLNNMVQVASNYCIDKSTENEAAIYSYLTLANFTDINLRFANGNLPSSDNVTDEEDMQKLIIAAVQAAVDAHTDGNDTYWDKEHNCAKLTYHQLQGHIIDGSLNHGEGKINGLSWCHLHEACAAANAGKPTNWSELITAAQSTNTADQDKIELLTISELEAMAHLRKNGTGAAFDSVTAFKNALVAAVSGTTGAQSWDDVQAKIVGGGDTATDAPDKYWWYDGATSVSLDNWSGLLAASQDSIDVTDNPTVPGEENAILREAKFNQMETIFDKNAAAGDEIDKDWIKATENLCITNASGDEGQKFASFDDFRTAYLNALTRAKNAGVSAPTWYQVQYDILHNSEGGYTFPATPTTAQEEEFKTYWWHNGGRKITDLASLIEGAQKAISGDTAVWDAFTFDDFCKFDTSGTEPVPVYPELHFRKAAPAGTYPVVAEYTSGDFSSFKTAVIDFVNNSGVNLSGATWEDLQYWLLHPGCDFTDASVTTGVINEGVYYWWKNGASGTAYNIQSGAEDNNIRTLMMAAYRSAVYGNPKAYDNLTAAAVGQETSTPQNSFRLIPSKGTETAWKDLPKYGTATDPLTDLTTALDNVVKAALTAGDDYRTVSWRQIQHYLLTGNYLSASDTALPSDDASDATGYWWRKGDSVGEDHLAKFITEVLNPYLEKPTVTTADDNALKAALDTYYVKDKLNIHVGLNAAGHKEYDTAAANFKTFAKNRIVLLMKNLRNKGVTDASTYIDWYILQYYVFNNVTANQTTLVTSAAAKTYYENTLHGDWAPSSVTGASLMMFRAPMMMAPAAPDVRVETSEDGLTTTTTTTEKAYNEATMTWDKQVTVETVVKEPGEEVTVITTTKTVYLLTFDTVTLEPNMEILSQETTVTREPNESVPAPTVTPEPMPTPTVTPEPTPTPTVTPEPTETPEPTPTATPEPTETPEPTPTVTPEPTETPEPTPTVTPEPTETPEPEETSGPTGTETPKPTETETPDDPSGSSDETDNTDVGSGILDAPQEEGGDVEEENITNFEAGVIALTELLSADSTETGGTENGGPPNETAEAISVSASDTGQTASDAERCTEPPEPDIPLSQYESIGRTTV